MTVENMKMKVRVCDPCFLENSGTSLKDCMEKSPLPLKAEQLMTGRFKTGIMEKLEKKVWNQMDIVLTAFVLMYQPAVNDKKKTSEQDSKYVG